VPSNNPTIQKNIAPTVMPSISPSVLPSRKPTNQRFISPSRAPSFSPSSLPSLSPQINPSGQPANYPSFQPTLMPTHQAIISPTSQPSKRNDSKNPIIIQNPSIKPTYLPSLAPSIINNNIVIVEFRATFVVANLTLPSLDFNHTYCFLNTIAACLNANVSDVNFLKYQLASHNVGETFIVFPVTTISIHNSNLSDSSVLLLNYSLTLLQQCVYSGKATNIFRANLFQLGVREVYLPSILAYNVNQSTSSPVSSPTNKIFSAGYKTNPTLNTSLMTGMIVCAAALICIAGPLMYCMYQNSAKQKKRSQAEENSDYFYYNTSTEVYRSLDMNHTVCVDSAGSFDTSSSVASAQSVNKLLANPRKRDPPTRPISTSSTEAIDTTSQDVVIIY
jgi:hypothetical protein